MARHVVAGLFVVFGLLASGASMAVAQNAWTAAVTGSVQGPDGARLPGVVVTLTDRGNVVAQVVSGERGVYRVSGVRPGRYALRAELQGFRPVTLDVDLGAARTLSFDLQLEIDSLRETVTVVGSAERGTLEPPRIRESAARDVGEALSALAGVWKVRRGAIASDLVIRGHQGENVTVLIDGARLYGACPNNMDHTAFHVDFAEVERIEVGKGPFDLKNQGGLGAAVNIVTKRPPVGLHLTLQLAVGSSRYVNPSLTASYGTTRFAVLAGYSYRAADAYRDGAGRSILASANYSATSQDARAFDVSTAWARMDASPSASHGLQVGYSRQRAGEVLYPALQMDAVYDDADRVNLAYDLKRAAGPVRALRAQGYVTRVAHSMTDARRTSSLGMAGGYSMATRAETQTVGAKGEVVVPGGTVGVEWYRRGWDTRTELAMTKYRPQASIPDVVVTSLGAYGEVSHPVGEALRIDLGARVDRTRNEADAGLADTSLFRAYHGASATSAVDTYASGKVRVTYRVVPALTVSGGVGRTVRVPDPQERYFGLRRAGSDWVGNPFLAPTTNTGVEVNVAYRAGRLFLNGNLHRDALGDFIGVYNQARRTLAAGSTNTSARSYRIVDATISGAELEAVLPVTDRLFVAADVSAVRGRQRLKAVSGTRASWLAEMPPVRGRMAVRYERRGVRVTAFTELEVGYSARQTRVDAELREAPTPAYSVASARLGLAVGRLRLSGGVANLFDRRYVEHLSYQRDPFRGGAKVYEPGRTLFTHVSLVF